ncbi:MAG: TIGR02300 family protein [Microvirga sp.]
MAKPELGLKRQCMNCGAKFYDLHRNPVVCPKCGTPFQAAALPRAAAPAVAARSREDDEPEIDAAGPELVSLEDVEAGETAKALPGDDVEIADDVGGDDNTFLEEEEEGEDDVSGLIDSGIDDDEET